MDEMEDFFGNDELDRESSPVGEEAIEDNTGEEGGKRIVEPKLLRTKKLTNPRLALNEKTLTGPKGITALRETFQNFNPNPKDDPYKNLEKMMKKYAYWGHLMFPKMKTEDVLNRVETLGTRRQVKLYIMKQRLGESTDDVENEKRETKSKNGIIDDGADDDEDNLFNDLPEKETPTKPSNHTEKVIDSPEKKNEQVSNNDAEEEEYRMMEEERLREEQEAREAEAEDELMEDFDFNNDW
ncbi:hypothetical protein B9Z55_001202 [Caenorhabditis nigoni]|uniref:TIMELESS-interacting protein n=1 Tax=Caenorhabditis nigoni TaxID=1611254 RepID=A0A2G5VEK4_9PELO|nr:hypothetical protein B9Z55_001202 [Caenorhabditis nigoni]